MVEGLIAARLDPGETSAILLAQVLQADRLLVDDAPARAYAESQGMTSTGTLGVLVMAAQAGYLKFAEAIARLQHTTFRASPALFDRLLRDEEERLRRQK